MKTKAPWLKIISACLDGHENSTFKAGIACVLTTVVLHWLGCTLVSRICHGDSQPEKEKSSKCVRMVSRHFWKFKYKYMVHLWYTRDSVSVSFFLNPKTQKAEIDHCEEFHIADEAEPVYDQRGLKEIPEHHTELHSDAAKLLWDWSSDGKKPVKTDVANSRTILKPVICVPSVPLNVALCRTVKIVISREMSLGGTISGVAKSSAFIGLELSH